MASTLPSPPTLAASPLGSIRSNVMSNELPAARHHPLRPGSQKETSLINYLDTQMLRIQRRYGKKFTESENAHDDAPGYTSIDQVVEDINPLLELAWASGTPSLQVSYLLAFAGTLISYMPAFPFSSTVFPILRKFDEAFVTLVQPQPSQQAAGSGRPTVTMTDKVRIKSLVADARVTVVNVASGVGFKTASHDESSDEDDDTSEDETLDATTATADEQNNDSSIDSNLGRVFQRTLEILGDSLT